MRRLISKLSTSIILALILITFGFIFIFVDQNLIAPIYFRIVSILVIIIGLFKLLFISKTTMNKVEYRLDLIEGILNLFIGVIFSNFHEFYILNIILFTIFMVVPLVRFKYAFNKANQFFIDTPKYIIAASILCAARIIYKIFFSLIGGVLLFIGIVIIISKIRKHIYKKKYGYIDGEKRYYDLEE